MKKILALLLAITMIAAFCACAQKPADTTPADTSADTASDAPAASDGKLIKVGIINNDPNESGYRTANDKDLKAMFTEENGYDASFATASRTTSRSLPPRSSFRTRSTIC